MKRSLLAVFLSLSVLISCKKDKGPATIATPPAQPVSQAVIKLQSITVAVDSVFVTAGTSVIFTVAEAPAHAVDSALVYTSGDTTIATIKVPKSITGIKPGKTLITIKKSAGTIAKTIKVTVVPVNGPPVTLSKDSVIMYVGNMDTVKVTSPNAIGSNSITWTSQDPTVATVDANGRITGVALGKTKVTATNPLSNQSASVVVWIVDINYFVFGDVGFSQTTFGTAPALTDGEYYGLWLCNHSAFALAITEIDFSVPNGSVFLKLTTIANSSLRAESTYFLGPVAFKWSDYNLTPVMTEYTTDIYFNYRGKKYRSHAAGNGYFNTTQIN